MGRIDDEKLNRVDRDKQSADLNFLLETGFSLDLIALILNKHEELSVSQLAESTRAEMERGTPIKELLDEYKDEFPQAQDLEKAFSRPAFTARPASEFGEDQTSFIWYPYIPAGDYTVLMAPGGTGKTYFVCGVAAAISKGEALPGDLKPTAPGNVLIISAEDRGELLKRRLAASGANLERVFILDCVSSEGLNFTDGYEAFRETIRAYAPRLVVIDPWHGFVGENIDLNRVNAVRPVFQRLANAAKECECGMVLISHVNKRAQGENANNAATGSTDFVNAARSALYLIFDEEDQDRRIVVHTKTNYARYGQSVCFRIEDGGIVWDGFSEIDRQTMEQAARQRKTPFEVTRGQHYKDETKDLLLRALSDAASPLGDVRFTYDAFKTKYGSDIFGTMQPKRIIDSVALDFISRGYQIKTGIQVKSGGTKGNGFLIHPFAEPDDSEQTELPF